MTSLATFYPTYSSLDSSIAPEPVRLGDGFSPEFLSLALLEKGYQHEDVGMPYMQIASDQRDTAETVASNMQGRCNDTDQLHYIFPFGPAPPASCEGSMDAEMNSAPLFLSSDPSTPRLSSFPSTSSGAADDAPETYSDNNRASPRSDLSGSKSSFQRRWQSEDLDKQAMRLKRNRAAARKSRHKKKREIIQLQNKLQEVSRRRGGLENEVKILRSQLLSLKDQILMHSQCDDKSIRCYLDCMVKQAMNMTRFLPL